MEVKVRSFNHLLWRRYWFFRVRGREREREKHRFVILFMYAVISWFLYVPWPGIEAAKLVYQDDVLTNYTTWPGLNTCVWGKGVGTGLYCGPGLYCGSISVNRRWWGEPHASVGFKVNGESPREKGLGPQPSPRTHQFIIPCWIFLLISTCSHSPLGLGSRDQTQVLCSVGHLLCAKSPQRHYSPATIYGEKILWDHWGLMRWDPSPIP